MPSTHGGATTVPSPLSQYKSRVLDILPDNYMARTRDLADPEKLQ